MSILGLLLHWDLGLLELFKRVCRFGVSFECVMSADIPNTGTANPNVAMWKILPAKYKGYHSVSLFFGVK